MGPDLLAYRWWRRGLWWFHRLLFLCIAGLGVGQGDPESCEPKFKANVERCLVPLQGFPVLTREVVFLPGDWAKTEVICRWHLVNSSSLCVSTLYAVSAESRSQRSLCGFQSLDPHLMVFFGQTVCRHRLPLMKYSSCLLMSQSRLESCLSDYNPILPTRLSTGLYKSPLFQQQCSYYAYAEHCYEKTLVLECPANQLLYAMIDILKASRPFLCSWAEIQELKTRYRKSEIYVIIHSSSDWLHAVPALVTKVVIGCCVVGAFFVTTEMEVYGIG